jgi:two-component system, OmpR family, phosphate regulon response regulator PhoB
MGELGLGVAHGAAERRVLIVEHGTESAQSLQKNLGQAGFLVASVGEHEHVSAAIRRNSPHLVMLDWDLPGAMAIDLIRHIRDAKIGQAPRLIILSRLSGDDQIVTGFELGADDYVVKPFSVAEVIARVRAVLRTADPRRDESPVLRFHKLELWVEEARVRVRDSTVPLRAMEYRVLEFLMRNPGRAFSRAALLDRVWGEHCRAQERAVDVVVQRMRKALAQFGCEDYVQTIRSIGYRLAASPAAPSVRAAAGLTASHAL